MMSKTTESIKGLCFVTGDYISLAKNHPKRIRNSADGAKIISLSNVVMDLHFLAVLHNQRTKHMGLALK